MSHMSTAAKKRKETRETKFETHERQNLTENKKNPAFELQYETAKESLRLHITLAASGAGDRSI